MKNRSFLLFLLSFFTTCIFGQQNGFSSASEAAKIATEILNAAGEKANFQIREANVPNAVAVLYSNRRYILYNPNFIKKLELATGTKWAAISVLAHEIGHHLRSHTVNGKTIPMATELEADEFSGFVLRKMGASLTEAQAAMQTLGNIRATSTHPAKDDRLLSIAEGWESGGGAVATNQNRERENTVYPENRISNASAIDSRYIKARIAFNADPKTEYLLTTRNNVVKVVNNQLYMVGKLVRLNNEAIPYMIYDDENRVYVNNTGEILTDQGRKIGQIKV